MSSPARTGWRTAHQRPPVQRPPIPRPPLARPRSCVVGGVSVALADHLRWPVVAVRWAFVGASFLGGGGVLLYLWLWALAPLRPPAETDPAEGVRRRVNVPWVLAGAGTVAGIAAIALAAGGALPPGFGALVGSAALLVLAVAWEQVADEEPAAFAPLNPTAFRLSCGAFLVVVALALALTQNVGGSGILWLGILITTFAGAAVLVAPWGLRLWRELITERTARIKEEQRAEMAAHLHDSVLQTLALIQNRAGASSEVGRIARAQERELREWLYTDRPAPGTSTADDVRQVAAEVEDRHGVPVEVVTAGDAVPDAGTPALTAATREALANAVVHGRPPVSLYVEVGPERVEVFVRDRGDGFDLDAVPEDRHGVRESIIGRMRRHGGDAEIRTRATGTEVHLTMPRKGQP